MVAIDTLFKQGADGHTYRLKCTNMSSRHVAEKHAGKGDIVVFVSSKAAWAIYTKGVSDEG